LPEIEKGGRFRPPFLDFPTSGVDSISILQASYETMIRPCFLVIDHEFPDSISTRKLVLETAKYNVITAYSGNEAIDTFRLFPNVSGIVMNEAVTGMDCASLVKELRAIRSDVLLIVTSSRGVTDCVVADHQLDNFDPASLLKLLRRLVPNPLEHYLSE
jgi:response regulator RpfG family c-di-GMP phosphodiesterase